MAKSRWRELTVDETIELLKKEVCVCGKFSDDGEKWRFDETSLIQPGSERPFIVHTPTGRISSYKRFKVKLPPAVHGETREKYK